MTHYKYLCILILSICIASTTYSQSFVSIKLGQGFPLGEFSDDELLRLDGYAAAGINFQAEGAYLPNKMLGIGLHYSFGFNPFTSEKYKNTSSSTYNKSRYLIHSLMALVVFQIYSNSEFAIQGRLLPGLSFIKTPEVIRTTYYSNGSTFTSHLFHQEKTTQMAFKFGMSFRYKISNQYFFSLTSDYYYCNARFNTAYFHDKKLIIEQLYVLLGIEYTFNN